eukprot:GHVT01020938.1.p1 GENE.GHVT01020938.1~~GHVT01020938.1.p1  ORF type:complete len:585 (-),score=134.39 GHVT01020938.1:294-2048(-)
MGRRPARLDLVASVAAHVDDRIWNVRWAPDGSQLASCASDRRIIVYTLDAHGELDDVQALVGRDSSRGAAVDVLASPHSRTVRAVAWAPGGRRLAACSFDSSVSLWEKNDLGTNPSSSSSSSEPSASSSSASPNSSFSSPFSSSRTCASACSSSTASSSSSSSASSSSFSSPSSASASCSNKTPPRARAPAAHPSASWEFRGKLFGHETEVKCVSWDSTGKFLATCSRDKSVWIHEEAAEPLGAPPARGAGATQRSRRRRPVSYPGDESSEEAGSASDDEDEGDHARSQAASTKNTDFFCAAVLNGHSQDVKSVCWHPMAADVLFSTSYDDSIRVWTSLEDEEWGGLQTLRSHKSTVWNLSFNRYGSEMVSGSDDQTIKIWTCLPPGALPPQEFEVDALVEEAPAASGEVPLPRLSPWYVTPMFRGIDNSVSAPPGCLHPNGDATEAAADVVDNKHKDSIAGHGASEAKCSTQVSGAIDTASGHTASSEDALVDWMKKNQVMSQWRCTATLQGFHTQSIYSVDWNKHADYIATACGDNAIRIFQRRRTDGRPHGLQQQPWECAVVKVKLLLATPENLQTFTGAF